MKEALESIKNLGIKKLAILGAAAATLLVGLVVLANSVNSSSLSPLYTNLSLEDSNKIITELDTKGIAYQLAGNGTQILVSGADVLRLRMAFAAEGIPSSGTIVGYEIFDKDEKLGTSNFMQNMNQLRALEGELARTIGSMNQVKSARVHLVVPKRELFQKDRVEPSASIQISMNGGAKLGGGEVAAIKYLTATAVPGLNPEKITIVDTRGILLARGGGDPNDPALYASNSQEFRSGVEAQMRTRIEELLEKYVGMGSVKAQVTADINFDRTVTNSEIYDPEGQVARSIQTSTENELANDGAGGGNVSVANNLPNSQAAGGGAGGSSENRQKNDEVTNFEISKTVKNQVSETGTIKKLSISVIIDGTYEEDAETGEMIFKERTPEELKKLEDIVKSAAGFDPKRGDIINISSLRFSDDYGVKTKQTTLEWVREDFQSVIQILVMGLVAMMVILMVIRPLVKRAIEVGANQQGLLEGTNVPLLGGAQYAQLAAPTSGQAALTAGAGGMPMGAGSAGGAMVPSGVDFDEDGEEGFSAIAGIRGPSKSASLKRINEMLENNPEETVSVIRSWLYGEGSV